ncbi:MAG: symmetrical bis(5'-nucleosyl)-tetraphosphatase [Neisseriaceae bacterium]|nr:symmetrical bis(5'-nucleosyl)-tetraphosphatase [Neisseriaceae bacterium]
MAHYVIGDLQGCFDEFQALLNKLDFNYGKDSLWLTGDIVNRGPKSLETIRFIMQHEDCMQTVLGNHDLHLLAVYEGYGRLKKGDTLDGILNAVDNKIMMDWLRSRPMMLADERYALVHAGLLPEWSIDQALDLAEEVEMALTSVYYREVFSQMYGNKPNRYRSSLEGMDRLRLIINVLTRTRAITRDGALDLDFKGKPKKMPPELIPWFQAEHKAYSSHTILFGHWSSLGFYDEDGVVCLDSGALWGGKLTAMNLADHSTTKVKSQTSLPLMEPKKKKDAVEKPA